MLFLYLLLPGVEILPTNNSSHWRINLGSQISVPILASAVNAICQEYRIDRHTRFQNLKI